MAIKIPAARTESTNDAAPVDYGPALNRVTNDGVTTGNDKVEPVTSDDLLDDRPLREFILLGGKDGVGKTCALVSTAAYVEQVNPDAKFYVIDSENKFRSALKGFGADAPKNIVYYKCDNMNQITYAVREILRKHQPGDWLGVESMSRIWERAQDMGYMVVSGYLKAEYMEERDRFIREHTGSKKPAVTPQPDQLWSITKGAHDGAFVDLLTQCDDLNVIMTTILSKPPKKDGFMKESQERKSFREEHGIDAGLEGAPRLPYYAETLGIMEMKNGVVTCTLLRDNNSPLEEPRVTFPVDSRKSWGPTFFSECRG